MLIRVLKTSKSIEGRVLSVDVGLRAVDIDTSMKPYIDASMSRICVRQKA